MDIAILKNRYFREYSLKDRIGRSILSLLILCIGGLIYIGLRDKSLLMFDWFNHLGISQHVEIFRGLFNSEGVYGWVKNSLPDGLWLFSYMFLVDAIWNGSKSISAYIFIYYLPILALVSEFSQYFGLVPGVFDWIDVASYLFAILLYITIKLL
jgi:hypothetical protein